MTNPNQTNEETGLEIAIIGMAGRFPGARDIEEFWDNLKNGRETISYFTEEEVESRGVARELYQDLNYVKARGILEDQHYFDAAFFNYTPIEAEIMDPQVRIFHECCWHALEHAGYDPSTYKKLIGLYAGASAALSWEAYHLFSSKIHILGGYAASLLRKDYLCTKTSFKLGLRGPSFYMQTACSTSLLAIHLACQGLLSGESQMALAGGVALTHQGTSGYIYQEGTVGSIDGHCRAFDARAAGTIRGEGVGIVVLKLLSRAIKDGDTIHAVIKGSAINNDGDRKVGFTAPSVTGQAEVIWAAQQMAEVEPSGISYIETHGTGTRLGDPVEINALKKVFQDNAKHSCAIGAVKSNIGHLDTAAGVAGVIKTVLALKHRLIPPSLHFETPNPEIDFEGSPFYVNSSLSEWKSSGAPLRAGISSFGIGGTNVHVILEESPAGRPAAHSSLKLHSLAKSGTPVSTPGARENLLIPLSARTEPALTRMMKNLAEHLENHPEVDLADAAYTLQLGRKRFLRRKVVVCKDRSQAITALTAGGTAADPATSAKDHERPVVFMFPGQGSQYENMGLDLYRTEPLIRQEMDRCFRVLRPLMGYDLKEILYPSSTHSVPSSSTDSADSSVTKEINQTRNTQPLLFVFEYAIAKLLMQWGIEPYTMVGHSIGEYVAACLAGVMSLEDALGLVCFRGRVMQELPSGSMLSVPLAEEELKPLLSADLSIAAVNTTARCVVSGTHEAVTALENRLKEKGIETRRLHTSHAFHSPMMDPVLETFAARVKSVTLNKPGKPYISNVTGTWITAGEAVDPGYWVRHIRETVRYADGLSELLKKEEAIFVEIGPGKVLSTFVTRHRDKKPGQLVIGMVRHPNDQVGDDAFLLKRVGQLWVQGAAVDWEAYHHGREQRRRIPLPGYSFECRPYPAVVNLAEITAPATAPLPGQTLTLSPEETSGTVLPEEEPEGEKQGRPVLSTAYEPPRGESEQALAAVFERFFGIQPVGINDNFYELGGDSLNAVQLADIARKAGIDMTFQQLLEHQDIRKICKQLSVSSKPTEKPGLETIARQLAEKINAPVYNREYLCSDSRYRVLFLEQETVETREILEYITEITVAPSTSETRLYPNYIIFIEQGKEPPASGAMDERQLLEILGLKPRIADADLDGIMAEVKQVQQFTAQLKENEKTIVYDVSPVQRAYLVPPYGSIAGNFIYYSYIFNYPTDLEEITGIVAAILDRHSLLRSVINLDGGRYVIQEYSRYANIRLPYIDISAYAPSVQKEIAARISRYLWEPIEVIDHVLFKAAILKTDHGQTRLVFVFNHLIFDGTSISILDNQLRNVSRNREEASGPKGTVPHYRDYVEFMKTRDYGNIRLEKYLSYTDYMQSTGEILGKFKPADMKTEVFDLDISVIPPRYKDHYEEIVLLAYARLIRELFGVEKAPITMVSNGRIYKDARFDHIIGEFPDEIPVLFSFSEGKEPRRQMEEFVEYKRFIRENNFNFYNYLTRGYFAAQGTQGTQGQPVTLSPFVFNSLMGSYDILTRIRAEERDMQGVTGNMENPFFYMGVLEDYYANRLGIRFLQNSSVEVKEIFIKNYLELLASLRAGTADL